VSLSVRVRDKLGILNGRLDGVQNVWRFKADLLGL
jgi:hypothetical protein